MGLLNPRPLLVPRPRILEALHDLCIAAAHAAEDVVNVFFAALAMTRMSPRCIRAVVAIAAMSTLALHGDAAAGVAAAVAMNS